MATKKCGDCIHADVCERNPLYTEFSRDNPAYCEGFKDKSKPVEVVRCKACKHRIYSDFDGCYVCHHGGFNAINQDHFCSYGERRTDD